MCRASACGSETGTIDDRTAHRAFTVLDLTRVLSGPYCTMVLADMGARVIKVEHPGKGDDTRHWGPPFLGTESAYFLSINRNKESVTRRLQAPARAGPCSTGCSPRADVLVENFRPGTIDRARLRLGDVARAASAAGLRLDLRLRADRPATRRSRLRRGDSGRRRPDERHRRRATARPIAWAWPSPTSWPACSRRKA